MTDTESVDFMQPSHLRFGVEDLSAFIINVHCVPPPTGLRDVSE